ncbi:MAG: hypothetical protein ACI35S_05885 [Anaeroplasma sp.]
MAKKVKKINKIEKSNNEEKKHKFKFGRNLGSLLIIIIGVIVIFFSIYIPSSYISVGKAGDVTPFVSGSTPITNLDNVIKMDADKFDLFDIDFYATKYDTDADKITFSINFKWTDNTSELCDHFNPFSNSNSYNIKAYICLASDWVGFTSYSTVLQYEFTKKTNVSNRTSTLTGIKQFPQKVNTFPIKVKVEAPDTYLYLNFKYDKGGKTIDNSYILKYTYNDYHTDKTIGGIPA